MSKAFLLLIFSVLLISSCSSEKAKNIVNKPTIDYEQFQPQTNFDKCLNPQTFQLLAAAKQHLEAFITNNLIQEGEPLAAGYQRYCLAWTGEVRTDLDTKNLLGDEFATEFYEHSAYKDIWVRLTELGDTIYTEEMAYDEEGNGVIVKFIENYWTLNINGSFYKCLDTAPNALIKSYLIDKEFGNVEPQNFAFELHNNIKLEDFSDPIIQNIIVTDLYLRLIAVRKND